MPPTASLSRADAGGRPDGLVLMLHGGRASGLTSVDDRSASWRRSRWMMGQVASRLNRGGASVWLLRHGVRGWNAGSGDEPSPVPDARWALHQVRRELGDGLLPPPDLFNRRAFQEPILQGLPADWRIGRAQQLKQRGVPEQIQIVGKDLTDVPDANGKKYRREIIELAAAKGKGWVRTEGKEYVVRDGDVMNFLFNV